MVIPRSVQLKLDRATHHLTTLQEQVESFLADKPYAERRVLEHNGHDHVFVWDKFSPTPDVFALIAGDAVHNLRSALDHLAFALAEAGAHKKAASLSPAQAARIEFPITRSEDDFLQKLGRGVLRNVEPNAKAFIEVSQPYRSSLPHPEAHFLSIIAKLDNTDKHRTLNITGWAASVQKDNWPSALHGIEFQRPRTPRYESGAEIGRFVFDVPQAESAVPVSFGWGVQIPIPGRVPYEICALIRGFLRDTQVGIVDPLVRYL